MYTAYIGRRIVDLYNEHEHDGSPLTPKDFFDEVFFPVFFDHEKYLLLVKNAPFDQAYNQRKKTPLTADVRREKLEELHKEANTVNEPYWYLFPGGIDTAITDYTSGMVTDVSSSVTSEEVYCAWIGMAAGIEVKGNILMQVDDEQVLMAIVDGWKHCREFMSQTPNSKPHRVERWNGQWIVHRFGSDYYPEDPLRDLNPQLQKSGKYLEFGRRDWVDVIFALARQIPDEKVQAYIYKIAKRGRNVTVGFRQLYLPEVHRLAELYTHLFGEVEGVRPHKLAEVYETEYSLYRACEQGTIGLKALRPRRIDDYMPGGRESRMPKPTRSENKRIRYFIYQTWIIAMLNNQDLIDITEETAKALREHAASDTKGRTTARRRAEQVLEATHRRAFLEALTEVIEHDGTRAEHFNEVADEVVKMPTSDFPLFAALLRLKYHVFAN